jgi:RNA polymerase sigma-70 factor (sigma-E family)
MAPGEPDRVATFPIDMTGALVANTALGSVAAEGDADQALTAIYSEHYRTLVRMAALLVRDTAAAEEVVQDSFVAMHQGWRRLRDSDKALSYLLQSVVSRSRSVLRRRTSGKPDTAKPLPGMPSAGNGAALPLERPAVLAALRELPARQREALVLRYYGDLPEAQIAAAMGIRKGAVHSHTARAIAALRAVLDQQL